MYIYLQVQAGDELYFVNVGTKRYLVCVRFDTLTHLEIVIKAITPDNT